MFCHLNKASLLISIIFFTLTGCQSNPKHSAEVEALIQRTLDNMVFVEGGSFMMGNIGYEVPESDPEGEWVTMEDGRQSFRKPFPGCSDSCYPIHKVTLTGFYINKFETTLGEYDVYSRAKNLPLIQPKRRGDTGSYTPSSAIYVGVNWYDAEGYCKWLADITDLPIDLPTEAQWEYAARSRGKAVRFATDNGELEPGRNYRPYTGNSGASGRIDPPGIYPSNPLGIYNMTGNANEWVRDWYHGLYYEISPELNPTGPIDEHEWSYNKVSRGFGRANSNWQSNLVFRRLADSPKYWNNGFRCSINHDKKNRE
ncbi:MAG: sulfatase modifying factor 1 [Reinekea sp.]|jgi:sulfatase modifying factor 1